MCVHACSCESSFIHMVIRQQWELVHLSYGSWRSNSDHQAWRQVPLPSMPSRCWVLNMTVLMKMAVLRHYWEMILFFWEGCSRNSSSAGSRLHYCSSLTSDSGCLDYTMNLESCFVTLPQEEGLPGFRGVRSAGPKEQSLCETPDYQQRIQATFHFSRSSLQALANLNKKLTGHIEEKKIRPHPHTQEVWACCFAVLATYSLWWFLGGDGAWGSSRGIAHHHWATGLAQISVNPLSWTQQGRQRLNDCHPTSKIGEKLLQ